jgi:hypothetical protein
MDEVIDYEDTDDCGNTRLSHYSLPTGRYYDSMLSIQTSVGI